MACSAGPDLKEDGLVLALDGANYRSFKGFAATNLLYSISNSYGEQTGTHFKTSYGNEQVLIPALGYKTVRYCNIYNDYPSSGDCCPNLLRYGGSLLEQTIAVQTSTTYTYQIIYKTTSGYTHPNFMYRYEFGASGYVTEGGVHNDSNRTSLGDGWYHAWGQFTTQPTTTYLWLTGMWYYQYGVYDKVSVAGVSLHQGTFIISPQNMLLPQENRGTTVATGGGWADLSGKANHGELVNGVREDSANGGSLVFDGSNDYVELNTNNIISGTNPFTFEAFYKVTNTSVNAELLGNYGSGYTANTIWISGRYGVYINASVPYFQGAPLGLGTYHMAFTRTSAGACTLYKNGVVDGTATSTASISSSQNFRIGSDVNGIAEVFGGNLYSMKVYNRALTASEIQQNFNATRSRFGI